MAIKNSSFNSRSNIVHILEIFMWKEDYCLNLDVEDCAPFFDGEEDFFMEDLEDRLEIQARGRRGFLEA